VELTGRRIILTGAARGIGQGLLNVFVREGASVVALDVMEDEGRESASTASAAGPGSALFLPCDVSNKTMVDETFATAVEHLGGLDALVNVAGISRPSNVEDITEEQWDAVFAVNMKGTLFTNQAAFGHMKGEGGRILNFASAAGVIAYPRRKHFNAHYAASKAAVIGFVRAVCYEWGQYGITVNAVCPTMMTPMLEAARSRRSPEELARWDQDRAERIPIDGKPGQTERDLAPFMVFMVGEGSRFITGQTLMVDGGSTLSR
jgi:NAD(P)-dependent dehydrogenase (short-subunit alcohol dehydrogenase family)